MDPVTSSNFTRTRSLRATAGEHMYTLTLADQFKQESSFPTPPQHTTNDTTGTNTNLPQSAATGSAGVAQSTLSRSVSAQSTPTGQNRGPRFHDRRRNRSVRLSLSLPKPVAPPASTTPVSEEPPSIGQYYITAPDLYVSPKAPKVHKSVADGEVYDNTGDFLTLLAAKERRVVELKSELAKAEDDLKRLQNQYSLQDQQPARRPTSQVGLPQIRAALNYQRSTSGSSTSSTVSSGDESSGKGESLRGEAPSTNPNSGAPAAERKLSSFPFPSPPRTAPSGRSLAPPRTSSLFDVVGSGVSAGLAATGYSSPAIEDLPYIIQGGDEFEYDEENMLFDQPTTAKEVIQLGRKIAGGINKQFWTLFDDLASAAIGEEPNPSQLTQTELNQNRLNQLNRPIPAETSPRRSRSSSREARGSGEQGIHPEQQGRQEQEEEEEARLNDYKPVRRSKHGSTEPLGVSTLELRGSPHSKTNHRSDLGDHRGYSVLHSQPAGVSTSLIDLESSEDESTIFPSIRPMTAPIESSAGSGASANSKRFSMYGTDF
ncbi:uncharacterized protein V1516DRAFT_645942 [Lipomyces oligophaga]|uniref:uncharacterized protein n=1 Tax=Lipomyces oligophaga TaxID=45792 RepID=UPI0034CE0A1E